MNGNEEKTHTLVHSEETQFFGECYAWYSFTDFHSLSFVSPHRREILVSKQKKSPPSVCDYVS